MSVLRCKSLARASKKNEILLIPYEDIISDVKVICREDLCCGFLMAIPVYIYVLRMFNSKHRLCRHASAASQSLLHAAKMSAALSSHEVIHRRGMIQPQSENAITLRSLGDKDRPTKRKIYQT